MEMILNIYSNERDENGKRVISKTYRTDEYDLMYGTVEDILTMFDVKDLNDTKEMIKMINKFRGQLNPLLKDVFWGLTDEELRNTQVKELVPVIVNILTTAITQFTGDTKNVMRG